MKKEDIEKGINNLIRIVNQQKAEILELKDKLAGYESQVVAHEWEKMRATPIEAHTIITRLTHHMKSARENYGNGN